MSSMVQDYIKQNMDDRGIKQVRVAEKIGMPPQILGAMLNGKRRMEVTEFFEICAVIELDPTECGKAAGVYKVRTPEAMAK